MQARIYEAGTRATVSTLHFTPNFRRVDDLRTNVTLTSSHPSSYSALFANGLNTMALPAGAAGVTAQFQLIPTRRPAAACSCDGDREDDEVVVTAVGGGEVVATTTITVVDVHKLPEITVTAMTESGAGPLPELAEGSKYKVKVEANRNKPSGEVTSETVTVTLPLADSSDATAEDYRLTPASVSISGSSNDQSKTFTLEVLDGDGDIGEEMLVLDAMVKGGSVNGGGTENKGMLSVTLVDTTMLNVEPKSEAEVKLAVAEARNESEGADNLWTAGDDDVSIMLGDLFKLPSTGFNISADAVSGDADVVMAEADSDRRYREGGGTGNDHGHGHRDDGSHVGVHADLGEHRHRRVRGHGRQAGPGPHAVRTRGHEPRRGHGSDVDGDGQPDGRRGHRGDGHA